MGKSNLVFENDRYIIENFYSLEHEATNAALLATGNGYMGVRGSFEEFGSIRIQGCYIRGLIDKIYEFPQPIPENIYMKKYYFDELRLKKYERQDCVINFADILLVRIKIDGETFYPWEGKILYWKRVLDLKTACLTREVRWESPKGDVTYLKFERFSSFDDDHLYCQRVTLMPENHSKPIEIISGLDIQTKTNGQRVTKPISTEADDGTVFYRNYSGDEYRFIFSTCAVSRLYCEDKDMDCEKTNLNDGDTLANVFSFISEKGRTYTLEKKIHVITSRDTHEDLSVCTDKAARRLKDISYEQLFFRHTACWEAFFSRMDVVIKGDDVADMSLRFSNYHSAISIARNDAVHSLGAKGLTGEQYNNFVWWDCEVYQLPMFFYTAPEAAKNALIYRYSKLDAARKQAEAEGRKGARFPFNSSVTGFETVWAFVRHPFMQIHIVADVAWGVINYYSFTKDLRFMMDYGLEILWETARYWASRVEYNSLKDRYEIKTVTGTDEHHPYVDNNAYTNYLVCLVLNYAVRFYHEHGKEAERLISRMGLSEDEAAAWKAISEKVYLPINKDTGMIPQFDDYFKLNRSLEVAGGSSAKSYQMKESGLYHESQVIKQPDVMLLFSYLNLKFDESIYKRNWNYYEARCEASSSLSYPVHAICAADMDQPESAYKYFLKSARIDLDDVHNCAWQGIHSACAAGAWLAVVRGVAGIIPREDRIEVQPHMIPWWDEVQFGFEWHGQKLKVLLNNQSITLTSLKENKSDILLERKHAMYHLSPGKSLTFDLSIRQDVGGMLAEMAKAR